MEVQWPLVIFTLFVCLTCGLLGGMSLAVIRGKGKDLLFPTLIASAVSLVIGGIGSFLHLEHWERIFNGFGHLTSGITQELIGCVVLAILMVVWFVMLRGKKGATAILAWVTLVLAVLMVLATAHSYMMAARPAWGFGLIIFYLANAFFLGAIGMWIIAAVKKDEAVEGSAITMTLVASIVQVVANAAFVAMASTGKIYDFGHYADPTTMTTAPIHIENLMTYALTGPGALLFWCSLICAALVAIVAFVAKKKVGASMPFGVAAIVLALVASVVFRVLIYELGFAAFLMY